MNRTLKELILAAEFAAIISVLSQMTIPFGLVPLTGQTFAIGLTDHAAQTGNLHVD